jgi:probable phosphoglycerate mutase
MKAIDKSPGGVVLLVSHGDVIKSIVAEALELELDKFQKIVIDPSSISVLDFSKGKFRILHLNDSSTCFEYLDKKSPSKRSVVGGGSGRS